MKHFIFFTKDKEGSTKTTVEKGKNMDIKHNRENRPKYTHEHINSLQPNEVFVFGSNLAGQHAGGAARTALNKFGAIRGQGVGLQGQSYAIPTMQGEIDSIAPYVDEFIEFAKQHQELFFYVTRIGCGIAGFQDEEIAPLFKEAEHLSNVCLPKSFCEIYGVKTLSSIKSVYVCFDSNDGGRVINKFQYTTEEELDSLINDRIKKLHNDFSDNSWIVFDCFTDKDYLKISQYKKYIPFDNIQWLEKFKKASQNNKGFREERKEIFEGTIKYVQQNGYNTEQEYVSIDNNCIVSEYFNKPDKLSQTSRCNTKFSVINADCLETAEILLNSGFNPCVLNLASRQNPGGGVLKGSGAQEENLFRRTNLFISLYQYASYANEYGIKKSEFSYPLDRNTGGIYTENATVFRSSEKNGYCLLNKPFKMSFVTVAALSHPGLTKKNNLYYLIDELIEPTKEKIRTILRITGKYNHDSLVLGAFGCGAFANPPNHIAKLFKEVFFENEFLGVFKYIVFSIFEDRNSGLEHNPYGNVLPFFEVFDEI